MCAIVGDIDLAFTVNGQQLALNNIKSRFQ